MKNRTSVSIIAGICLVTAVLHFLIGPSYEGILQRFFRGYFLDILLPMSIYLLLQVALRKQYNLLKSRFVAAVSTFFFGLLAENLQFMGLNFLGDTWDPLDLVMYIIGIALGILIDLLVIDRFEKSKPD